MEAYGKKGILDHAAHLRHPIALIASIVSISALALQAGIPPACIFFGVSHNRNNSVKSL